MTELRLVGLISSDLMFRSRLEGPVARHGARLIVAVAVNDPLPVAADPVFVDLNADPVRAAERLAVIGRMRQADGERVIVAFCQHEDRERRVEAMARGASQVVTNGSIDEVCDRLLGRAAPAEAGDATAANAEPHGPRP